MKPPTECGTCLGLGWLEEDRKVIACPVCDGTGWVPPHSPVVWHCVIGTDRLTCNPKHVGVGHVGCGWFVPLDLVPIR